MHLVVKQDFEEGSIWITEDVQKAGMRGFSNKVLILNNNKVRYVLYCKMYLVIKSITETKNEVEFLEGGRG